MDITTLGLYISFPIALAAIIIAAIFKVIPSDLAQALFSSVIVSFFALHIPSPLNKNTTTITTSVTPPITVDIPPTKVG